jgi:hypothetical protein
LAPPALLLVRRQPLLTNLGARRAIPCSRLRLASSLLFPKGSFGVAELFHLSPRREGFSRKIRGLNNVKR